jgi:hypothetical protein
MMRCLVAGHQQSGRRAHRNGNVSLEPRQRYSDRSRVGVRGLLLYDRERTELVRLLLNVGTKPVRLHAAPRR